MVCSSAIQPARRGRTPATDEAGELVISIANLAGLRIRRRRSQQQLVGRCCDRLRPSFLRRRLEVLLPLHTAAGAALVDWRWDSVCQRVSGWCCRRTSTCLFAGGPTRIVLSCARRSCRSGHWAKAQQAALSGGGSSRISLLRHGVHRPFGQIYPGTFEQPQGGFDSTLSLLLVLLGGAALTRLDR